MVHVLSRDTGDLLRIDNQILAIDGVEPTETSLSMSEILPHRMRQLLVRAAGAVTRHAAPTR